MGEREVQRRQTLGDPVARLSRDGALTRPIVGDACGSEVQPLVSFDVVLANAVAALVHEAELQLRFAMSGFRGGSKPLRRLAMVLHDAGTAVGQDGDLELRLDVAIAGGATHPDGGGSQVRNRAEAVRVHEGEFELGIRLVALSRPAEGFDRRDELAALVSRARSHEVGITGQNGPRP